MFTPLNAEQPAFVVSLDFELHWGILDHTPASECRDLLLKAREGVPKILELFDKYELRATWATVGALFCDGRDDFFARVEELNPHYREGKHLLELGESEKTDPLHFAPSLIRQIQGLESQEIGTHTFTHIYGCESNVSEQDFEKDLSVAVEIAAEWDIALRSIVFPRNQFTPRMLENVAAQGITTFRGCPEHWSWEQGPASTKRVIRLMDSLYPIYQPKAIEQKSLTNVPATLFFRTRLPGGKGGRLLMSRVKAGLDRAAKEKSTFHLWWHPHNFGVRQDESLEALENVLKHFSRLRQEHGMKSLAMQDFQECIQNTKSAP
jgi:peptidoglycan/xylan/chitin deacetylase (PgdA/CDA1 family)